MFHYKIVISKLFILIFSGFLLLNTSTENGFSNADLDIVITWKPIIGTKRGQIVSFTTSSKVIHSGDTVQSGLKFNLAVRKKGKYYLYVVKLSPKNQLSVLFPHKSLAQKNPVGKGVLSSQFGRNTGQEQYYIFVSSKRQSLLEGLIRDIPTSGTSLTSRLAKKLKRVQRLRLLKVKYQFDVQSIDDNEYD